MIPVQKGERPGVVARAFAKSAWRWSADEWDNGNTRTALGQIGHGCCMEKERQGKKGSQIASRTLHGRRPQEGDQARWVGAREVGDHLNYKHPSRRGKIQIDDKWTAVKPGYYTFKGICTQGGYQKKELLQLLNGIPLN